MHDNRPMRSPLAIPSLLGLAALLALVSCRSASAPGVKLTSTPPGARVMIDGRYSGHVTPCLIALDDDRRYEVTFELGGYEPRSVVLEPAKTTTVIGWGQGRLAHDGQRFPLWLMGNDIFQPIRIDRTHSPARVFARLQPLDDAPVYGK